MIGIGEYCYDDLLMGRTDRIGGRLFFSDAKDPENEREALELIRYGISYYLGWSPEETARRFSEETLGRLGLSEEVKGLIAVPTEAQTDPAAKREYLLSLLYPERCSYDPVPYTEACYENGLLKGRLPEGLLEDGTGVRAGICLLYALKKDGCETSEEMFRLLARSGAGRWLASKRLRRYCDEHFAAPVDFLKKALGPDAETDALYREAIERIRRHREGTRRRYGKLGFAE